MCLKSRCGTSDRGPTAAATAADVAAVSEPSYVAPRAQQRTVEQVIDVQDDGSRQHSDQGQQRSNEQAVDAKMDQAPLSVIQRVPAKAAPEGSIARAVRRGDICEPERCRCIVRESNWRLWTDNYLPYVRLWSGLCQCVWWKYQFSDRVSAHETFVRHLWKTSKLSFGMSAFPQSAMACPDSLNLVLAATELIVAGAFYEISVVWWISPKELLCPRPRHPCAQGIGQTRGPPSRCLSAMRQSPS